MDIIITNLIVVRVDRRECVRSSRIFDTAPILSGGYQNLVVTVSKNGHLRGKGGNYIIRWGTPLHTHYIGETVNLQDRLQHHVQHMSRFGLDPKQYQVLVTNKQDKPKTLKSKQERLKRQEASIRNFQKRRLSITNIIGGKSREFEYLFEVW
ncbi:MAG: hypothetical protein V7L11_10670 [Nostoc sp.]|uniref:hypothetical protein n=1 Tax=Nostoc sp. TaxID=1180 RepID=UPI002FFC22F9